MPKWHYPATPKSVRVFAPGYHTVKASAPPHHPNHAQVNPPALARLPPTCAESPPHDERRVPWFSPPTRRLHPPFLPSTPSLRKQEGKSTPKQKKRKSQGPSPAQPQPTQPAPAWRAQGFWMNGWRRASLTEMRLAGSMMKMWSRRSANSLIFLPSSLEAFAFMSFS